MNDDRGAGAMPKLYGAPAYARPPVLPVKPTERPYDPDDLPIESQRTGDEDAFVPQAPPAAHGGVAAPPAPEASRRPVRSPFRLRLPGGR